MRKIFVSFALAMCAAASMSAQFIDYDPTVESPEDATHGQFFGSNLVVPDTVISLRDVGTVAAWMKPHSRSRADKAPEPAKTLKKREPVLALSSQKVAAPGDSN